MPDFTNKSVLITGATGGIGSELTRQFLENNATVVLTDRSEENLVKFKSNFSEEIQKRIFIFPAELTNAESLQNLVKFAEENTGKVDILVNNAGLTKDGLFMRMNEDDWNLVLNVNLSAGFKLCKAVIRGMIKRRYGRIINMASVVGYSGNIGQANYSASKAGLVAMTKSLAQEVASRNITANCVAPGFIQTKMTDALPEEVKTDLLGRIPTQRFGQPSDVANAVLFLADEKTSYITGQTIHVNGGMFMI